MLEILDTAGQDDFESLRGQWMMDKDGYIFVYSMDSRVSLHVKQFLYLLHSVESLTFCILRDCNHFLIYIYKSMKVNVQCLQLSW